jgi:DNA-binding NarL/FixJ family response regulator
MIDDTVRQRLPRRVVVVDHHAPVADRLRAALDSLEDFDCVGTAVTATQAYALAERTAPDLVVVDLMLRGGTGLALIRRLRAADENIAVVVTAVSPDVGWLAAIMVAGAHGFAPRKGGLEETLSVLRSARPGRVAVAPSLLTAAGVGTSSGCPGGLTARESHVLTLMSRGASAAEIARVLSISLETSRNHVRSVHGKLGVRTPEDAVVKGRQIGLLESAH